MSLQPLSATDADADALARIAARNGFSVDAARVMLDALVRGGGRMAQFSHPEFSGSGQWMYGGMTMISAMFDNGLKARVGDLCTGLAALLAEQPDLPARPGMAQTSASRPASAAPRAASGWPAELGQPSSSGSQNGSRYAVFDATHRLAIERDGRLMVYDTLDHRIGGAAQQQSGTSTMRFTSQNGVVDVERLPLVSGVSDVPAASAADIPATIEKLADLNARGILSRDEFIAKKAELLARI